MSTQLLDAAQVVTDRLGGDLIGVETLDAAHEFQVHTDLAQRHREAGFTRQALMHEALASAYADFTTEGAPA